ncbi:PREDICTED: RALF [Prunus dulcis]|uniref:PREDICTED: RALF n=1 Tax=Prunus dulcis TaxID=3755 RepID=A0A5E4F3B9_PRUDU|nr:hypothetical protein L3X38_008842 [Prunus dulcis]VVA20308.1 PREDICTED: RALF [Prunus dulcis]
MPTNNSACKGSIAECLAARDEEFDLDSEINRRILATSKYISYGAMQRNTVPCFRRGASCYNCQPGAQSNPYSSDCNAITSASLLFLSFQRSTMKSGLRTLHLTESIAFSQTQRNMTRPSTEPMRRMSQLESFSGEPGLTAKRASLANQG